MVSISGAGKRVAVAEFHHMGDAVMALPFVRGALAAGYGVDIWCRESCVGVFEEVAPTGTGDMRVFSWEPPWHEESRARSWGVFWKKCEELVRRWKEERYDAAVSVWADARVHGLFAAAGIERRVGFPMKAINYYGSEVPWRKRRLREGQVLEALLPWILRRRLLTEKLWREDARQHHLRAWGQVAEAMGFSLILEVPWFREVRGRSDGLARILRVADGRKLLFVHPWGRLTCKTWFLDGYREVWTGFLREAPEWCVMVCEAPGEGKIDEGMIGSEMRERVFIYQPRTFSDLLAGIEVADGYLGNDSLGAHVAAGCGKPVVTVFGSSDPRIYAPGGDLKGVVRSENCTLHPCMDVCRQRSVMCLEGVTVGMVMEAVIMKVLGIKNTVKTK
jgi:heptosyltransferase-2